jgi:hypothetical protein
MSLVIWIKEATIFSDISAVPLLSYHNSLRDTRRASRRFQGGPHDPGLPGTFLLLSQCLSEGVMGP